MGLVFLGATHSLKEAELPLRIFFGFCLVIVFLAGLYVFSKRKKLFGQDPQVTNDIWAVRNLRLWQVLLVWLLAMELLIEMIIHV